MRVLVVDDDPIQRKLLHTILATSGQEPVSAADGVEALEALRTGKPFDAVITDILMPRLDGYRLCYAIRRDEVLRHLPVVVYTATYTSASDEKLARTAGADVILRKPAAADRILETLERVVREPRGQYAAYAPEAEFELLKQYSEALVQKLEDRNIELEAAHARLLEINEELKRSEGQVRLLLDSTGEGIYGLDLDGKITFSNASSTHLLGYDDAAGLIGRSSHASFHHTRADGTPCPRDECGVYRTLQDGRAHSSMEELFWRPDGTCFPVEYRSHPLRKEGRLVGAVVTFTDVSERKRIEDSLRKSEKRFFLAFHASPVATSISEAETSQFLDVNDQFLQILGYTREEILGQSSVSLGIWADEDVRREFARNVLRDGGVRDRRTRIRAKTGELRDVVGSVVPVSVGGVPCFLSTFIDVTDRERTEQALRGSEERYRLLFEASPRPMWVFDVETLAFLAINDAACSHYGYSRDEFLRMTILDIRPPSDIADLLGLLASEPAEFRESGVWPHRKKDGSVIAVEISSHPFVFDGRQAQLVLATDVTERLRAEREKRESEERYRVIFDASPLPTWLFETRGLEIYDVNQATIDFYGYTREEFRTMTLYDLRTPEEAERLRVMYTETPRPALRWNPGVWQHRKKDGTLVLMDIHTHEVEVNGRPMRLAVQIDVTEQRRLEAQLRQSQKMEAVGQLAGGIAHDFNNILTTILGYGSLALERIDRKDPLFEEILEIQRAGERAAELTKKLLAFSRKQILDPRVIDLNSTVAGVERMLRRIIGEDIRLLFRPAADLGRVRADPGQVEQVLMNLGVNARDAMPSGGALTIETANVELDEEYARAHADVPASGDYVLLAVSDSGCGMDALTRARMFEPFFTTKELGKGTGLGLSTVYGIVKQSGGYIWCYSEPGLGTTFKIYFSRVAEDVSPVPAPAASMDLQGSETILLVEDEEALANLARRVLLKQGYHVLTARSGAEARDVAAANPKIDLLLTDVVMPGMSGRELAEELLRELPTLRVLYMSGYTDDAIVHHGFLDAGLAFLQKPFTPDGLARKVREVLRREK